MQLLFLGTGAADWLRISDEEYAKDGRRTCSALLDGHILLDVAPKSFEQAQRYDVDLSAITDLVLSHSHSDHFSRADLLAFADHTQNGLRIWCNEKATKAFALSDEECRGHRIDIHPLTTLVQTDMGNGWHVTGLPANHVIGETGETALQHILETDDFRFFYGCDGGWLMAEAWGTMRAYTFDAMIFDVTVGDLPGNYRIGTHNTIPMMRLLLEAFRENNVITPKTKLIADHLSRTLHPGPTETEAIFAEIGMIAARDGLLLDLSA